MVAHPEKCIYCGDCEATCVDLKGSVHHDLLSVQRNPTKFIFSVETTGSLAPEDVVQQALHVLRKKMLGLQEEVQERMDADQTRLEVAPASRHASY